VSRIRPYTEGDAGRVLALHRKMFPRLSRDTSSRYVAALTQNPWRQNDIAPLVCEETNGDLIGFLGVMPRRMALRGHPVRAAVLSSFMVDPERGSPVVAAALLRRVLDGPQDLTYGDGASDRMRRLWEANGRTFVAHLSMRWIGIVSPARFAAQRLRPRGPALRVTAAVLDRVSPIADRAVAGFTRATGGARGGPSVRTRAMTSGELATRIGGIADRSVRPVYTPDELSWLLSYLGRSDGRAPVRCLGVELDGRQVGWIVVRHSIGDATIQVLQMGSRPGHAGDVLRAAFSLSREEGAASVQGRVDAAILRELWDHGCVLTRGPWFLIDAPDPELVHAVHAGDAFISSLEKASLPDGW
jgi:hypothetical protein